MKVFTRDAMKNFVMMVYFEIGSDKLSL